MADREKIDELLTRLDNAKQHATRGTRFATSPHDEGKFLGLFLAYDEAFRWVHELFPPEEYKAEGKHCTNCGRAPAETMCRYFLVRKRERGAPCQWWKGKS